MTKILLLLLITNSNKNVLTSTAFGISRFTYIAYLGTT